MLQNGFSLYRGKFMRPKILGRVASKEGDLLCHIRPLVSVTERNEGKKNFMKYKIR